MIPTPSSTNSNNFSSPNQSNAQVISYLTLREMIGIIGISLPFLLMLGTYLYDDCSPAFQYSISHYYYTKMHILFVGLLCVLGAFLITYKGNQGESNISTIAGILAILVSVFPDDTVNYLRNSSNCSFVTLQPFGDNVPRVHLISAACLFISFAIICAFYFTKPDVPNCDPIKKKRRNFVYRICSAGILLSIFLIFLYIKNIIPIPQGIKKYFVLTFETTALFFFGLSWLLKGSLMWPSKKYILPQIIRFFR